MTASAKYLVMRQALYDGMPTDIFKTRGGMLVTMYYPTESKDKFLGYFDRYTGKILLTDRCPDLEWLPVKRVNPNLLH